MKPKIRMTGYIAAALPTSAFAHTSCMATGCKGQAFYFLIVAIVLAMKGVAIIWRFATAKARFYYWPARDFIEAVKKVYFHR